MQLVDAFPHVHGRVVLQATLTIKTASLYSCEDLYSELCTAKCRSCGDFAPFLYLITCQRVCYLCFTLETEYLPTSIRK
jgi:hypothetical protein